MPAQRTLGAAAAAFAATIALAFAPAAFAGEGPPPGTPPLSATTPPAAAAATGGAVSVRAQYVTDDGLTHGTTYEAAPGVSAAQLYQRLRAQGVQNLVAPADSSGVTPLVGSCGYGTASSASGTCPPATWARNGFTNPQIYYYDTSSSSWPVGTVLGEWNESPNIHAVWSSSGCSGTSGTHCVKVTDAGYGQTGWAGQTSATWNSSYHFIDGSVSIKLNDSYASVHRSVACTEVGLSIGVGYNSSSSSCMYSGSTTATWPNSDDYNEILYKLYPR